jgi:hypothetical protein
MPDTILLPPTSAASFVAGGTVNIADIKNVQKFTNFNSVNKTYETPPGDVRDDSLPNFVAVPGLGEHTIQEVSSGPTYYVIAFTSVSGIPAVYWVFTDETERDGYYNGIETEIGVEITPES